MKLPTKIPTLIGLTLLVLVVGSLVVFSEGVFRMPSRALDSTVPKNVQFSNISDVSFTVSWITSAPAGGVLSVAINGKNNRVYYDERDTAGNIGKYNTHSITIRDAKPNTEHTIKILTNGRTHPEEFQVRTPGSLPPNTNILEPAYGSIHDEHGSAVDGALVYLTFEGGQQLSSITKPSGIWLIPLSQVRTEDLSGFLTTSDRTTETILVKINNGQIRAITDPLNDSPVPDMVIGQTYDFRGQQVNKITGKSLSLQATPIPNEAVLSSTTSKKFAVSLATPAEGAAIPSTLPLLSGTGIPNTFVGISIGISNPSHGSTKVKPDGTWNFTPTKHLAAGRQSATITTTDEKNKAVAITHSFQILKSGTQVLGDATPSATLTTTLTLTPSPTTIASQTATPTQIITETPEESTIAGEDIPTTGNELPTIILLLVGLGLLATGLVAVKL